MCARPGGARARPRVGVSGVPGLSAGRRRGASAGLLGRSRGGEGPGRLCQGSESRDACVPFRLRAPALPIWLLQRGGLGRPRLSFLVALPELKFPRLPPGCGIGVGGSSIPCEGRDQGRL